MSLPYLLLLLMVTQLPLVAFLIYREKLAMEERSSWTRLLAANYQLPWLDTAKARAPEAEAAPRPPRAVRHLMVPVPRGAGIIPPNGGEK